MKPLERLPLKMDRVTEAAFGRFVLRYPKTKETEAERAAEVLETVTPVVERYLGAVLEGIVRLDLLEEARASGSNPSAGIMRHAALGLSQLSPRVAGLVSYQLGKILWYRSTNEAQFLGRSPRSPDWLTEAALLPLLHIWSGPDVWRDYLAAQINCFVRHRPLAPRLLEQLDGLDPQRKLYATAQCLLRGQSVARLYPEWVRELRRLLAEHPSISGTEGLVMLTGERLETWETTFQRDIHDWVQSEVGTMMEVF